MAFSRREFLQAGLAVGVSAAVGSAQTRPLLGLIAPPADYPVPPEGIALYDKALQFSVVGLGLKTMTPAGYDSVIDRIVPSALELKKRGVAAIDLLGTSLTFYRGAAFNEKLLDDIRKAATDLATEIAQSAPLGVVSTRETMRRGLADAVEAATERELVEQDWLRRTADFKEGVKATAERRLPNFQGK